MLIPRHEIRELVREASAGIPESQLDEMAIPSYLHGNPLIGWLLRRRHQAILKLAQFTGRESVLDFGCGIGLLLPTLCERAKDVHATDLFPQLAEHLVRKKNLRVTFHPSQSLDQSITNASLDLIIAQESMEHLDDPREYVMLFRRKLKPDGRLIMSGPTENLVYRLGRLVAGFGGKGGYHHSNVDQLDAIMTGSGWERRDSCKLPFAVPPHIYKVASYRRLQDAA